MTYREISSLKKVVDEYMHRVPGIDVITNRCLRTERWGGSVVLMIIDAAFTSIGLNYFTAVIPKVEEFGRRYVDTGSVDSLDKLSNADLDKLREVWKNRRSWAVARGAASSVLRMDMGNDKEALRAWAKNANLREWGLDPVGRIIGVGIVTFQYLRMMGGVDTVMPDKIVKRVLNEILIKSGIDLVKEDVAFVERVEDLAKICGYRPIDLCWMTWLVQPEGKMMRMAKYSAILSKI
ncbi:MAG: hypothetical protein ABSF36_02785 [Candidatus Methanomethylicaceae archaeon]|jgi:hypothetical protein